MLNEIPKSTKSEAGSADVKETNTDLTKLDENELINKLGYKAPNREYVKRIIDSLFKEHPDKDIVKSVIIGDIWKDNTNYGKLPESLHKSKFSRNIGEITPAYRKWINENYDAAMIKSLRESFLQVETDASKKSKEVIDRLASERAAKQKIDLEQTTARETDVKALSKVLHEGDADYDSLDAIITINKKPEVYYEAIGKAIGKDVPEESKSLDVYRNGMKSLIILEARRLGYNNQQIKDLINLTLKEKLTAVLKTTSDGGFAKLSQVKRSEIVNRLPKIISDLDDGIRAAMDDINGIQPDTVDV